MKNLVIQLDIFPNKAFAEKENFIEGNYSFATLNEVGSIDVNSEQIEKYCFNITKQY